MPLLRYKRKRHLILIKRCQSLVATAEVLMFEYLKYGISEFKNCLWA